MVYNVYTDGDIIYTPFETLEDLLNLVDSKIKKFATEFDYIWISKTNFNPAFCTYLYSVRMELTTGYGCSIGFIDDLTEEFIKTNPEIFKRKENGLL